MKSQIKLSSAAPTLELSIGETAAVEATVNALQLAKAAKKNHSLRAKMALAYQAIKSLYDQGVDIDGMEYSFWKAAPTSADFGGLTLTMDLNCNTNTGLDRAVFANLATLVAGHKKLGADTITLVIRKGGFSTVMA